MTYARTRKTALAFLDVYADPDIDKRLYFDVWADRTGLNDDEGGMVWLEVRRLTYRLAAQKREATRRRNAVARSRLVGVDKHRHAGVLGTE